MQNIKPSQLRLNLPLENPLVIYPQLAKRIGLNEAIVLQQLHYWLTQNEKKPSHNIEDKVWCYNTVEEWQENFPFWSKNTIIRTINKLEELKLIIKSNFNKLKFDKTIWYSINYDNFKSLFSELIDLPKMGNGETQNGYMEKPNLGYTIPETTTETTTDNNIINNIIEKPKKGTKAISKSNKFSLDEAISFLNSYNLDLTLLKAFIKFLEDCRYGKGKANKPVSEYSLDLLVNKLKKIGNGSIETQLESIQKSIINGYLDFFENNNFKELTKSTYRANDIRNNDQWAGQ